VLAARLPAGRFAENKPGHDGVWRQPAPSYLPCCLCGQLALAILPSPVCPQCATWRRTMERIIARVMPA
jgi:hypothetical protein